LAAWLLATQDRPKNRKRTGDHMSDNQRQVYSPLFECDVHFDTVCHSISVSILILQKTPQSNVKEVFDLANIVSLAMIITKQNLSGWTFIPRCLRKKIFMDHLFYCIHFFLCLKKFRLYIFDPAHLNSRIRH
jgi:hypothetical protein